MQKKRREELDQVEAIASIAASMLEVVFYVCALDLRVRTSYSLCQIVSLVSELKGIGVDEQYDRLMHIVSDELRYLVDDIRRRNIEGDSVELYNLLICGAHYIGADFVSRDPAKAAVHQLAIKPSMSYFAYITAKFCAMKSAHTLQDVLDTLNKRAKERIVSGRERVKDDSELFLMFCDFLSSPDVALREWPDPIGWSGFNLSS